MILHILVPGLNWPSGAAAPSHPRPALSSLDTLIGKGRTDAMPAQAMEEWLCRQFNVLRQSDWPVAPLTLLAERVAPEEYCWIRADPVHLVVDRDRLVLTDAQAFAISADEATALTQTLNEALSADGSMLLAPSAERWYMRLPQAPGIVTRPLAEARGASVDVSLPAGEASRRWRVLSNEVQMLLHEHPINEQREARGAASINSVWFWGAGRLPEQCSNPYAKVWADCVLAQGLVRASGGEPEPLPTDAPAWLSSAPSGIVSLLVLDHLRAAAHYHDSSTWVAQLQRLEREWFAPLLAALRAKQLERIHLHSVDGFDCGTTSVSGRDLWKFWRSSGPRNPQSQAPRAARADDTAQSE
jgi:hypothetical protein